MSSGIIAGAIRWDSWYSQSGDAYSAQVPLGPTNRNSSAPWFSNVISPYQIQATGSQANMDAECVYASNAGIKFWAFDWYTAGGTFTGDAPLATGWTLYQASANKHLINWCGIVSPGFIGSTDWATSTDWHANVALWVSYMQQTSYQLVMTNRPLLFILYSAAQITEFFGSDANFATAIAYLRAQCIAASLATPYIVLMSGGISTASQATLATTYGVDAISNYIPPLTYSAYPDTYANLDTITRASWVTLANTTLKIIPNCITGWNVLARTERPETFAQFTPYVGRNIRFTPGTDTQVANHLQAAVTYIKTTNPTQCESTVALIYSWTECNEGANPLIPTLGKTPTVGSPATSSLLTAVAPVIT